MKNGFHYNENRFLHSIFPSTRLNKFFTLDETSAKITALKRKINEHLYSVTIMLVNDDEEKSNGTRCLFQPVIKIESEMNGFRFCEYSSLVDFNVLDSEEQSLELQYRNKRVYGTGLGTSVNWEIDTEGNGIIYNDFFPETEVPQMDFTIPKSFGIKAEALSMRHLSDLDRTEKSQKLSELRSAVEAYGSWIDALVEKQKDLPAHYQSAASINISGCLKAKDRMLAGLRVLDEDAVAWTAFSLANRAMFMQRVHLKLQSDTGNIDRYPGDENLAELLDSLDYSKPIGITGDNYAWRLFQIAFLLMSIESITNDFARDRNIVDLIWFPTGGGKTEAYLGLTAFTIFFRRLAHLPESDGTTVIMRYTLRLLAAQQFTRASTLICACEFIRNDAVSRRPKYGKYPLGNTEITIGLWIGREHIPNTNADAKKHLKELTDARTDTLQYAKEQHNKFQVLKCPWCGTKLVKDRDGTKMIGTFGYRMRNNRHFELFCPQESCFFNQQGKLPIQIIDEELYACPPTLLFGTVDKFAMIPWKKDIGAFFAAGTDNRAPDLVIQDELHLISGPLGTMVGLYEAAIDALCTRNGIRAKIVASTATIRRAKEQCSALYNREVSQFPHPGLDAEDSFFARESIINYDQNIYGRKYVGLMPSGKTKAMMEVRSIAALMQEINTMNLPDDIKDKFWTLTVYFNSLKDLGKCSTLVDDDVKDFIKRTAFRLGSAKDARMVARADELTSRVNTTQLNETLDKLEKLCYSRENIENKRSRTPERFVGNDRQRTAQEHADEIAVKTEDLTNGCYQHIFFNKRHRKRDERREPCRYDGRDSGSARPHRRNEPKTEYERIVEPGVEKRRDERGVKRQLYALGRAQHAHKDIVERYRGVRKCRDRQILRAHVKHIRLAVEYPHHAARECRARYREYARNSERYRKRYAVDLMYRLYIMRAPILRNEHRKRRCHPEEYHRQEPPELTRHSHGGKRRVAELADHKGVNE